MKILVVSNMFPSKKNPSYGTFVKNFCDQLEELKIDFDISVMKKSKGKVSKIVSYIFFFLITFTKCLFQKYDVIYIHYASNSSIPVLWASKLKKMTIYTNVHGSDVVPQNKRQEKMQKYTRKILSISNKIIAPSEYFRIYVAEKYDISEKNIYISYSGGIDDSVFYKENLNLPSKTITLGYVSRISKGKGWDVFLKACAQIKDYEYKIIMVGSGPQKNDLENLIDTLGLKEKIELYPLLEQKKLRKIYNQIDIFVFSTCLRESLGLVAIEAMACGTPVIASDFAAPSYYIKDGVNGYKFEMGNEIDLCNKIIKFIKLNDEGKKVLQEGAILTASEYKKERVLEQMRYILLEENND